MKDKKKELSVNFEIVIREEEGRFIGECRELPGLVAGGANSGEVIRNLKAAIPLYLRYVPKESFIPVYENEIIPIIYDFEEFNGHLYAATNKDTVIRTSTGDTGSWESITVANIYSPYFNGPVGQTKSFEKEDLGDYTPQVYCLKTYNDLGTPKLFCGTNASGGIYESLDGKTWSLSFNSQEARIHCMEVFKGKLFAGTSTEGKIYSYNGTHWVISINTTELAVTAFGIYRDYLYAGTYPNGVIYRTADGINWQKIYDTNQSFVNGFYVFKNRLYASTSKATGGLIFMTEDGTNWVENFFSEKDVNFYGFASFSNNLYVGSGDNGRIYKSLDGKRWELAFQTDEEDVRSLRMFNGYLYFGSSPKGRIFKTTVSNTPPPRALDIAVSEITSHSAAINWRTDREAQTIIEYGIDESYGNNIINETMTAEHRITLNNLRAMTKYHFRILTYSDMGSFSGIIDDYTLTTAAAVTPVIESGSHSAQEKWYKKSEAEFKWGQHLDIKHYLYMIDQEPDTIPEPSQCSVTVNESVNMKNLDDGVWYLHLRIEDKAGNISSTASHFCVKIDTQALPPVISSPTHEKSDVWYSNNTPVFTWEKPQDLSGIEGYYYIIDDLPGTVPGDKNGTFTMATTVKSQPIEDGVKYIHVVSKDAAGNVGTKAAHYKFCVDTTALIPALSSRTHPDEESWYNKSKVELHIARPQDLSGIEGFYYTVDQKPDTKPSDTDWVYTKASDIELPAKTDGTWYVHLRSKDFAGNISAETAHFKFKIDTQALPPNISSVTHPDSHKWYNLKKAQFKIMPPEDLSGIEGYYYLIDTKEKNTPDATAAWTDKDTIFSSDLKDGEWYLHVTARDKAGNSGQMASHYRINIDTAAKPPAVYSRTHPDQEQWYNNSIPELHWDTPEDLSGIEGYFYTVDKKHNTVPVKENCEWTTANQVTIQPPEDGIWYFHIISKDNAGNTGWEAFHYKLKIDTKVEQPRISSSTHPDESKWYNSGKVKISWTVPQDLSKIKAFYYLFSKERHLKISPEHAVKTDMREAELNVEDEGTYYFHIVGEDNAGNIGEDPAVFTVKIDLVAEPPKIISTTHVNPEKYYSNISPVFAVEKINDMSGVDGYYYIIDRNPDTVPDRKNSRFVQDGTIKVPDRLEDGEWYFHILTKDASGNIGTEATHLRFMIEITPPEVTIAELPEFINAEKFDVSWDAQDKESGVACFDVEFREGEKGKWKPWLNDTKDKQAKFSGSDGIRYHFRVRAKDNAGNWSQFMEPEKASVTVDITPPTPVTQLVAKPQKGGEIHLEWNKCSDSVSGLAYYRIYRSSVSGHAGMQINDDGETIDTKFIDASKDIEDGIIYYYTVRPVDKIGNERESGNKQVLAICDRAAMPPVVRSLTHPMQGDWYNVKNIKLTWDTPQDATRITGYYYIFDQTGTTLPGEKNGTWFTDNEIDFNNVSDGTWYFHIVSKDEAGNISEEASHYTINVDTTKPKPPVVTSITHPDFNGWYNGNSPSFSWTVPPDQAGIDGYYYVFNQIKNTTPQPSTSSWTKGTMASFVDVPDGVWYLHVTAKDTAGNISEEASHFQVNVAMTPPPPAVFSSTHPEQDKWYRDKSVKLQWKAAQYVNSIVGYYYVLDNTENTIPTPKNNKTMDTHIAYPELSDGVWYFHMLSIDKEGVTGKTAYHFKIKIKTKVKLKGVVTHSNGIMPLAGATVEVMKEDGATMGIGISDKEGNFEVDNLSVGKVKVKVLTKNLPPQMIYDVELNQDEPEKILNISTEIFAFYEETTGKMTFSYYIPEDGAVTIKVYNEAGKILSTLEENKKGKIYNSTVWDTAGNEDGIYLYQISAKGSESGKITRYGIRKIKKGK
ncbi:MAG: hypothetical protein CVV21_10120 [Candidatus Goldiibacteriota bacterium HGW-Goldbacteria-1]|nr:MAG: hypothetical protein CVV21_10120 [Candidatus Goldiibacteriota bacterium HGW-Goldbacteria-1]